MNVDKFISTESTVAAGKLEKPRHVLDAIRKKSSDDCGCDALNQIGVQVKDCGTGAGGFQPGNTCGSADGQGDDAGSSGSIATAGGERIPSVESDAESHVEIVASEDEGSGFETARQKVQFNAMTPKTMNAVRAFQVDDDTFKWFTGQSDSYNDDSILRFGKQYGAKAGDGSSIRSAAAAMKEDLEIAAMDSQLKCCVKIMRGMSLSKGDFDSMVKSGFVTHSGVNSWTTDVETARGFASASEKGSVSVMLLARKPRVGWVNSSLDIGESEVIRPPSEMKISKVTKAKDGSFLLEVDEDSQYEGEE